MSIFSDVKKSKEVKVGSEGVSQGGVQDSHVAVYTIKAAFTGLSKAGAKSVTFHCESDSGTNIRKTIYATSGLAKGQLNYYLDRNGDKVESTGFTVINNICQVTTGNDISDLETETKTIPLWDFDAGKEVNTDVDMLVDLVGQKVKLAILRKTEDSSKCIDNAKDDDGKAIYTIVGTRDVNEFDRVFCTREGYEDLTAMEITGGIETPVILPAWLKKWEGKTSDRSSEEGKAAQEANGGAPSSGSTGSAPASKKPKKSLFGKKD